MTTNQPTPMTTPPETDLGIRRIAAAQARTLADAVERGEPIGVEMSRGAMKFFAYDQEAWDRVLGNDKLRERLLADPGALWG